MKSVENEMASQCICLIFSCAQVAYMAVGESRNHVVVGVDTADTHTCRWSLSNHRTKDLSFFITFIDFDMYSTYIYYSYARFVSNRIDYVMNARHIKCHARRFIWFDWIGDKWFFNDCFSAIFIGTRLAGVQLFGDWLVTHRINAFEYSIQFELLPEICHARSIWPHLCSMRFL